MESPRAATRRIGRDRYVASVAQSRCCAEPVTLLPDAPVFGERAVCRPGDAPKATPEAGRTLSGFGKGIRTESAQAHESGVFDVRRIVEGFTLICVLGSCRLA